MFIKTLKKLSPRYQFFTGAHELRKGNAIAQVQEYERLKAELREEEPKHLALHGYKVYSQNDEDGIIAELFRRIGGGSTFMEIGVQTGVECNSLLLLLSGWRGTWVEGSTRYAAAAEQSLGGRSFADRFKLIEAFVRRDNIRALYDETCGFLGVDNVDFFSLDIDGTDVHVLETLLGSGARPRALCLEYQAKFPPPVSLTIRYGDAHVWDGSDYMGSSLQAFVDMLQPRGYRLVACNIPGVNAFFVREDLASAFPQLPVERLYQPYRWYLSPFAPAQPPSLQYLRDLLKV